MIQLPVTIHNTHGSVTIPDHVITLFKLVMGPVNLFLKGQALGDEGKQIIDGLSEYEEDDEVQVIDEFEYRYSGVYKIVTWNLSSTDNRYEFDLGFKSFS